MFVEQLINFKNSHFQKIEDSTYSSFTILCLWGKKLKKKKKKMKKNFNFSQKKKKKK